LGDLGGIQQLKYITQYFATSIAKRNAPHHGYNHFYTQSPKLHIPQVIVWAGFVVRLSPNVLKVTHYPPETIPQLTQPMGKLTGG